MSGFPLVGGIVVILAIAIIVVLSINKKKEAMRAKEPVIGSELQLHVEETAPAQTVAAAQDDDDVFAVIAAVIAAMSKEKMAIRVISRVQGIQATSWSLAGRQDIMSLRQQ